jgi:carboxypeptidase T
MPYLNIAEANSLMHVLELQFPAFCERIVLPNQSFEGRASVALRIRIGQEERRPGVLLIGGQHAREWGSTDILLFLAKELMEAYEHGNALHFGNFSMPSSAVHEMLDNIELIVFPVVNPDGKRYSQTEDKWWRKNRAPTPNPAFLGTDLNRNYDWLWDVQKHFREGAGGIFLGSEDPSSDLYRGLAPFSEPETRNVRHLLDTNPQIRFFVDVHSYSGYIMHPWADDDAQTTDPTMSFAYERFDGQRAVLGDTDYGEYMSPGDLTRHRLLVHRMNNALAQSRGTVYTEGSEATVMYQMSGAASDYAFSRHLADRSLPKIDSFLIEWGLDDDFQPPFSEMTLIIREVAAALAALCLSAKDMPLVEKEPDPVLFGNIPIGGGTSRSVEIRNRSRATVNLEQIRTEGPGYHTPAPHTRTLNLDGTASVQVVLAPEQEGSAEGALRFEARYFQGDIADNVEVRLEGGSCTERAGDCFAPLIQPHGPAACAAIRLRCIFLLALLTLFGGSDCSKAKLRFRIAHCREGNGDPCLPLLP